MHITFRAEPQIQFLTEKRSKPYRQYGDRVSQQKIGYETKNLGGVFGSTKKQIKVAN